MKCCAAVGADETQRQPRLRARTAPERSQPRRIANGVMLNKSTVLKNVNWLLPVSLWRDNKNVPNAKFAAEKLATDSAEMLTHNLSDEHGSNVYCSTDQGMSFGRIRRAGMTPLGLNLSLLND